MVPNPAGATDKNSFDPTRRYRTINCSLWQPTFISSIRPAAASPLEVIRQVTSSLHIDHGSHTDRFNVFFEE